MKEIKKEEREKQTNQNRTHKEATVNTKSKSGKVSKAMPPKKAASADKTSKSGSLFSLANIRKPVGSQADDSQPSLKAGAVEVHKPSKNDIVRVHPDAAQRVMRVPVFEFKQSTNQELYLVMRGFEMPEEIADLVSYVNLFRAINQLHVEFVWPVKTGENLWNQSSQESVYMAMKCWVRVFNKKTYYEARTMKAQIPEPEWSDLSFEQLIGTAFADRLITSPDHRIVRLLQGLPESGIPA
jgi:hypothetical protein